jgi:PhoPQ-activated pathogenicity-related protein
MMNIRKLMIGALAGLMLAGAPALAGPSTALDAYVAKPDPAFGWQVVGTFKGPGYHGAVLDLTSQTWLDASQVDRPVWKHWMTVIVPDALKHRTALLYIGGGQHGDPAPTAAGERFAKMAVETNSVVVELGMVPNQPLKFSETPDVARVEDDIIAYQHNRYIKTGDTNQIVRLAMVKSATQAMTAVQQYLAAEAGGRPVIDKFVVSGASKRGWTTWLVGALDARVVAIMPLVIDVLNSDAVMRHHWEALGYFSPALADYVNHGIVPQRVGSRPMNEIRAIEDAYFYRDRPSLKMPKYIINAAGDEFFLPDNSQYYWPGLPEEKRLRYVPNSKHSMSGTDVAESMTAFYAAVLNGRPRPSYSWTRKADGTLVVRTAEKPREVRLWQATNPDDRDFRVDTIGKAFTSTLLTPEKDGTYVARAAKPAKGYTAAFVELTYDSGGKYPLKFTTEVAVTPNDKRFAWKNARPIMSVKER